VDIFSFGVVALEVVSNRRHEDRSLPDEMVYLLDWVPNSCEISNISDLLVLILSKKSLKLFDHEQKTLQMLGRIISAIFPSNAMSNICHRH
jgi:hypothetical protein